MIKLREFTDGTTFLHGSKKGREVYNRLLDHINSLPNQKVIEISLEGIEATDSSFPRESVISLAKQFRGEKWFTLSNFVSADLVDNWDYAAKIKNQPVAIWGADNTPSIIGPEQKSGAKELISYVLTRGSVSTAQVAKDLQISVQNASTRLKKLVNEGLIFRTEEVAASGGIEFIYNSVKKSA